MAAEDKPDEGDDVEGPAGSGDDKPRSSDFAPDIDASEIKHGGRPGDVYVRLKSPRNRLFRKLGPGRFVAMPETDRPHSIFERGYRTIKRILIGRPLETSEEIHQRLTKVKALAVFGSDAISSSAYATEAALLILVAAGNGALGISLYTALAIAVPTRAVGTAFASWRSLIARRSTRTHRGAVLITSVGKTWDSWLA